ncbi:DUF6923 family protein [Flavobacterium degerlachei]|jgi:hypothetical protein|uniref:Por secretion system C-terminal sorting domain-containing protein n=1 Tax=Flavobacterium degerlachei TaxID=229203 RepID=A0A1H3DPU1_9FLAO|nr:T9SS type A sorting domain-containing protein [Flavobacterium degerlachei]SDX68426.1 Por secretion system C-terminal sorting domain-containing protein [Flavobacterium degerlachei]
MKRTLHLRIKTILFCVLTFFSIKGIAQEIPFNCDFNAYLFQYNDVYAIDLASGNSILVAADITSGNINGAGYNPKDGYIWGYLSSPSKSIVRIGKNFTTTIFTIDELPDGNKYVGDVSSNGIYYFKAGGSSYYEVDLDPDSPTYTKYLGAFELTQSINVHDWAFNALDGNLYTVEQKSNILFRIHPETGIVDDLGVVPIIKGKTYTYGAVYFDLSGSFYISANQTGTVYVIRDVKDLNGTNAMESNLFAYGPSSSSNDGARCPTAPVPQEICDNGIDDDGDGLIDCEDPSCSGYSSCPVLDANISGGNDGGLESNNRLSEQINKRNFNRVKKGYIFNSATAKKVTKSSKYANKSTAITLRDFIPFGVINEDSVIESTPNDLLAITNASEVYSVDYLKNSKTIASILALKTDDGVYEHTKFICDRLLGAQIISVSTIDIQEQPFIKTIIKNADNSIEYVLSLSAKITNGGANFGLESHWNLDKYEKNIGFYNFQIWTNSIDDLFVLGEEVVQLINAQKPIASYTLSTPPTVFVRKGKYNNGSLELQVINTNATSLVTFDAGLRQTETSAEEKISSPINLDKNYITQLLIPTGNLFDIGFRIGDGIATPDDLFLSDGPWGVDDAAASTSVNQYIISPNDVSFDSNNFKVERNLSLTATTSEYIAAYRALTPRFKAVDLSSYKSFRLKAKGTGTMEIVFIKNSIENWDEQYKKTIELTNNLQDFAIPFTEFTSSKGTPLVLDDIKTIVFKMTALDGKSATKKMDLQAIQFSKETSLSVSENELDNMNSVFVTPNPISDESVLHFNAVEQEKITIQIFDILGKVVKSINLETEAGANQLSLSKSNLSPGLYFCRLSSKLSKYNAIKLIVK